MMTISRKYLKSIVIIAIGLFLLAGSFFVFTSILSEPTDQTLMGIAKAKNSDFNYCILLEKDHALYISKVKKTKIHYADLKQEIAGRIEEIQKTTFNIICTKETSYQQIVSILDIMSEKEIKSYQLLKV